MRGCGRYFLRCDPLWRRTICLPPCERTAYRPCRHEGPNGCRRRHRYGPDSTNNGTNYTKATVLITGGGGSGAVARAILGTTTGTLRAYYLTSNGNKVVVYPSAGTINYDTGQVILNAFLSQIGTPSNRYYDTDVFTFNAPLEKEIIIPLRNRILTIDMNDPIAIQIDMVAEQ